MYCFTFTTASTIRILAESSTCACKLHPHPTQQEGGLLLHIFPPPAGLGDPSPVTRLFAKHAWPKEKEVTKERWTKTLFFLTPSPPFTFAVFFFSRYQFTGSV